MSIKRPRCPSLAIKNIRQSGNIPKFKTDPLPTPDQIYWSMKFLLLMICFLCNPFLYSQENDYVFKFQGRLAFHYKGTLLLENKDDGSKKSYKISDFIATIDTVIKKRNLIFLTISYKYNIGDSFCKKQDCNEDISLFNSSSKYCFTSHIFFYNNKLYEFDNSDELPGYFTNSLKDTLSQLGKDSLNYINQEFLYKRYFDKKFRLKQIMDNSSLSGHNYFIKPLFDFTNAQSCKNTPFFTEGFYCLKGSKNLNTKYGGFTEVYEFSFRGAKRQYYYSRKYFISQINFDQYGGHDIRYSYSLTLFKIEK